MSNLAEQSLRPGVIQTGKELTAFRSGTRTWQGIPGVEVTPAGRLVATWYSGGTDEGPDNYVLLASGSEDGTRWEDPIAVVAPGNGIRSFDPVLWMDPSGSLWWFWSQSSERFDGRAGVFCARCPDPKRLDLWESSKRITDGVMMNKPTVLANGTWLAPIALWNHIEPRHPQFGDSRFSMVFASTDNGLGWQPHGRADVPGRTYDEHMVVELSEGSLWMLVRTRKGIGEAVSEDAGRTWIASRGVRIEGPDSRFHIRRLQSGRLLLVNHHRFHKRNNLTAMLSDDEGRTWYGHLLLDSRESVSYPDLAEAADGTLWCIYDRKRYAAGEILLAKFTEADVEAGCLVSSESRLSLVVSRLRGTDPSE